MGDCTITLIHAENPDNVVSNIEKISVLAATCHLDEEYSPVTRAGFEEFSNISIQLLSIENFEISYAAKVVRINAHNVAKIFLGVPDTPFLSKAHTILGPFYSSSHLTGQVHQITNIVNVILEAKESDQSVTWLIWNFADWSKQSYIDDRDLLNTAANEKHRFTPEIIAWIFWKSEMLVAVSTVNVEQETTNEILRSEAEALIYSLTFIPDTAEIAGFLGAYQLTESIFEFTMKVMRRDAPDIVECAIQVLLSWMVRFAKHSEKRGNFEQSLYALAALSQSNLPWFDEKQLYSRLQKEVNSGNFSDVAYRRRAARNIREKTSSLGRFGYHTSLIDNQLSNIDDRTISNILSKLADILDPQ